MFFAINLLGILVFLALGVLFSKKRKEIQWRLVVGLLLFKFLYRLCLVYLCHWPGNRIRCGGSRWLSHHRRLLRDRLCFPRLGPCEANEFLHICLAAHHHDRTAF